jgi:hypothetical protein
MKKSFIIIMSFLIVLIALIVFIFLYLKKKQTQLQLQPQPQPVLEIPKEPVEPVKEPLNYSIPICTKYVNTENSSLSEFTPSPGSTLVYPVGHSGFLLSTVVPDNSKFTFLI